MPTHRMVQGANWGGQSQVFPHADRVEMEPCPACKDRRAMDECRYCDTGRVEAWRADIIKRQLAAKITLVG